MAKYPVKMLKDEQGTPFVPLTHMSAVIGEEYSTTVLIAKRISTGHYAITNDEVDINDIKEKVVAIKFEEIGRTTDKNYLKLNNSSEYLLTQADRITATRLEDMENAVSFFTFTGSVWALIKIGADKTVSSGHTITNSDNVAMVQRGVLNFKGLSVSDDPTIGATKIEAHAPINNLNTTESGVGALDAYQGKVLKDSIPGVIDNLSSTSTTSALSANQGRILSGNIKAINDDGVDLQCSDNRDDNNEPLWYMQNKGRKMVTEFKYNSTMNSPFSGNYCGVVTLTPWGDSSGGYPTQVLFDNKTNQVAMRSGASNTEWTQWKTIFDMIYPIDSVYISFNSANPSTLFGGTWEKIPGRFLLGTGVAEDNTSNFYGSLNRGNEDYWSGSGSRAGQFYHTLSTNEMPSHSHGFSGSTGGAGGHNHSIGYDTDTNGGGAYKSVHGNGVSGATGTTTTSWIGDHTHTVSGSIDASGGGGGHNNMPPFITVHMWRRIA